MATITDEQARSYLFEVIAESEVVRECYMRFRDAANLWLEAQFVFERTGEPTGQAIEAERDLQVVIEGLLSGYARISLFFFPNPKAPEFTKSRAQKLRGMLSLDGSHPLNNRQLRNHWMHLDERLDQKVQEGNEVPIGSHVALPNRITKETRRNTVRLIDPGSQAVHVFGEVFPLRELADLVQQVGGKAALALTDES